MFSSKAVPLNVRFGPYRGRFVNDVTSTYCWQVDYVLHIIFVLENSTVIYIFNRFCVIGESNPKIVKIQNSTTTFFIVVMFI